MVVVGQIQARDPEVALLDALTSELGLGGYSADETFGWSRLTIALLACDTSC